MQSKIFYGLIDFSRLARYVMRLDTEAARSSFLLTLTEALADNAKGLNPLADEVLCEAETRRKAQVLRVAEWRKKQKDLLHVRTRTYGNVHVRTDINTNTNTNTNTNRNTNTVNTNTKKKKKKMKKEKSASEPVQIPDNLCRLSGFPEAWERWIGHLREKRGEPTSATLASQLSRLSTLGDPVGAIMCAIDAGAHVIAIRAYSASAGANAPTTFFTKSERIRERNKKEMEKWDKV